MTSSRVTSSPHLSLGFRGQSKARTALDATPTLEYPSAPPEVGPANPPLREVRHEYSRGFPAILAGLGASLVVATYQAGQVVVVGVRDGRLSCSFHNFERAMGVAVQPGRIAVGSRAQVWFMEGAPISC
jgi:hypothetical protein